MKGSVRKRKDGRWEGIVGLPGAGSNQCRKHVYADTRTECQRLVNNLIHDIATGQINDVRHIKGPTTELITAYEFKRKGEHDEGLR